MRGIHQWPVHSPNLQSFVSYNECAKFCNRMAQCGICIRLMNAMWDLCEGLFVLTLVLNWNLVKSRLPVFSFFRGWILMKFCTSAIFDYNVSYGRTKFCEIWVIDVIDERDIAKFQCEMEFGQIFCIVTLKWKFIILTKFSPLAALEIVTSSAASDENFVKIMSFPFYGSPTCYNWCVLVNDAVWFCII